MAGSVGDQALAGPTPHAHRDDAIRPGFAFISHAHADSDYVGRLAHYLASAGVEAWVDTSIRVGTRWNQVLRDRIDACTVFVVVMSPAAEESGWVDREIGRAEEQGKPIFPLLLGGERPMFRLGHLQYVNVVGGQMPPPQVVTDLLSRLDAVRRAAAGVEPDQATGIVRPSRGEWAVAAYECPTGGDAVGGGVLIDQRRVLTCASVARGHQAEKPLWLAFPRAGLPRSFRMRVANVTIVSPDADAALLELDGDAPAGVRPARLRCPSDADLVGDTWWAFGVTTGAPFGREVTGRIGATMGYGRVELRGPDAISQSEFAGSGIWSPQYDAVIALVDGGRAGGEGGGPRLAVTVRQTDIELPESRIGELARWSAIQDGADSLGGWGWTFFAGVPAGAHWQLLGRGAVTDGDRRHRFRGRQAALRSIIAWLTRSIVDDRVLVVTGSPGAGKSAVLGRVVSTADSAIRAELPADDAGEKAPVDSVACAVHAQGKTALDVAMEIARAAAIRLPEEPGQLAPLLEARLAARRGTRFNVVIDGLDEAASPREARSIVDDVIVPVVRTCNAVGAQVIVGTRRGGELVARLDGATVIDLDAPEFFAENDLVEYALATFLSEADDLRDSPHLEAETARTAAESIARVAGSNFLVAGLLAGMEVRGDRFPVPAGGVPADHHIDAALIASLHGLPNVGDTTAETMLTALAYAEPPGLSLELWQAALAGLGETVDVHAIAAFADSPATGFLRETPGPDMRRQFRLYHQALNDALMRLRLRSGRQVADHRGILAEFMRVGRSHNWRDADPYLVQALPGHADRAGSIDEVLADDQLLLHIDLRRLIPVAERATTRMGRDRLKLLLLTPEAANASADLRAALFSVNERLERVSNGIASTGHEPYRALWAATSSRSERVVFEGHAEWVRALCTTAVEGRTLVASGGNDGTVRLWDPAVGHLEREFRSAGAVNSLCALRVDHAELLAGASHTTVRVWDPANGQLQTRMNHGSWIRQVCPITVDDRTLLASCGHDDTVRLWDPMLGRLRLVLNGHTGPTNAACSVRLQQRDVVATCSDDGTVRVWDPYTGEAVTRLGRFGGAANAMCDVIVDGRPMLVIGYHNGEIRLWDPITDNVELTVAHQAPIMSMCVLDGTTLTMATSGGGNAPSVFTLDRPDRPTALRGHNDWVTAVCAVYVRQRMMVASSSEDRTVRLWDPSAKPSLAAPRRRTRQPEQATRGHLGVASTKTGGSVFAAVSPHGVIDTWTSTTGRWRQFRVSLDGDVSAVSCVIVDGQTRIAIASRDGSLHLWNAMSDGLDTLPDRWNSISAMCTVHMDGRDFLAVHDPTAGVTLVDPAGVTVKREIASGSAGVVALCPVEVNGRTQLAVADRTGRLALRSIRRLAAAPAPLRDQPTAPRSHAAAARRWWRVNDDITAMCSLATKRGVYLAVGTRRGGLTLLRPEETGFSCELDGHVGGVKGVSALSLADRQVLASVGQDRSVKIWNPISGTCMLSIPIYHSPYACVVLAETLGLGVNGGFLAIAVSDGPLLGY
jgi:WD40 repeat protein